MEVKVCPLAMMLTEAPKPKDPGGQWERPESEVNQEDDTADFAYAPTGKEAKQKKGTGAYPWNQCVADQLTRGHNMDSARRICGSIRARSQGLGSVKAAVPSGFEATFMGNHEIESQAFDWAAELEAEGFDNPWQIVSANWDQVFSVKERAMTILFQAREGHVVPIGEASESVVNALRSVIQAVRTKDVEAARMALEGVLAAIGSDSPDSNGGSTTQSVSPQHPIKREYEWDAGPVYEQDPSRAAAAVRAALGALDSGDWSGVVDALRQAFKSLGLSSTGDSDDEDQVPSPPPEEEDPFTDSDEAVVPATGKRSIHIHIESGQRGWTAVADRSVCVV